MGVEARIVIWHADGEVAERAAVAAYDRLGELNRILSDYQIDSELNVLCDRAGQGAIPISGDLFAVLHRAQEFAQASDGAFDVTIGPLSRLWREARGRGRPPTSEQVEAARALVDWRRLTLDPSARTARLDTPGMKLDLGGIGKGYAVAEARHELILRDCQSCLVELGGDVAFGDPPPGTDGWTMLLPARDGSSRSERLVLSNVVVSTSGDSVQYLEWEGQRYSHIIDPRTGWGVRNMAHVVVIARDGMTSDALASTISVLGGVEVNSLLSRLGVGPDVRVIILD